MKKLLILILFIASSCDVIEDPTPIEETLDAKLSFHTSYDHGGGDLLLYLNGEYKGKIRCVNPNVTCGDTLAKTIQLVEGLNTWFVEDYEGNNWTGTIEAIDGQCDLIDLWHY